MKSSLLQAGFPIVFGRQCAAALILSALTGIVAMPAFADDHGRDAAHQRNDHRNDNRGGHGWRDARGWHDYGHPYVYAQPVYVPPTVYVAPQESPGISLFLPLNFRR